MSVLAHGALGPADELVLIVPAVALLVLTVTTLRRRARVAAMTDARPVDDPVEAGRSGDDQPSRE